MSTTTNQTTTPATKTAKKPNIFSRCCTCIVNTFKPCLKKLDLALSTRTETVYVAPALPCLFFFILSMITSGIYIRQKTDYKTCEALSALAGKTERMDGYILGALIIEYSFVLAYANMIFGIIKSLSTPLGSFLYFLSFLVAGLVWSIIGVSTLSGTNCQDTAYYKLSLANIIIMFTVVGVLFVSLIVVCFLQRKAKPIAKPQIKPPASELEVKSVGTENTNR